MERERESKLITWQHTIFWLFVYACVYIPVHGGGCTYSCVYVRVHVGECTRMCLFRCMWVSARLHVFLFGCMWVGARMHGFMFSALGECMYAWIYVRLHVGGCTCICLSNPVEVRSLCWVSTSITYHHIF